MIYLLIYLFALHFIADFVFQFNWMAHGKSKKFWPLFAHVLVYTSIFLGGAAVCTHINSAIWFGVLNGVIHYIVDYFTSRLNSRLYQKEDKQTFFISVGFDQLLHAITILLTSQLL